MSSAALPLLIGLLALVAFWLDAARARELASALAQTLCQRQGVQFLDGSAALESLRLQRTPKGLRLRRVFSFSYYSEEAGRRQGTVTLVGAQIKAFRIDEHTQVEG
ncbi:MAG: DUF3301 domain-containing protein [Gammaproteobacteria bacterium SHHR-1]|uniref:DUF3301 domain-containing protein n=1 Tax=Magnetovirga frankeli TaxID=947516 RepID=UPI00129405AB|nr:DUF3301 domain-containing protein [gamma proteobacterium SS-5]